MKSIALSLLLAGSVFGYDVILQKTFTKKITPDQLVVNLNFSAEGKSLEEVLAKLENLKNKVSQRKEVLAVEKGFQTSPLTFYKNSKKQQEGYKGSLRYRVSSSNEEALQSFIKNITPLEKEGVGIMLSSGVWQVSAKTKDDVKSELELSAIKWAKEKAKTLSESLDDRCKLEAVSFSQAHTLLHRYVQTSHLKTNAKSPLAKKEKFNVTINADLKYRCH
jgi:predicted secreted protein